MTLRRFFKIRAGRTGVNLLAGGHGDFPDMRDTVVVGLQKYPRGRYSLTAIIIDSGSPSRGYVPGLQHGDDIWFETIRAFHRLRSGVGPGAFAYTRHRIQITKLRHAELEVAINQIFTAFADCQTSENGHRSLVCHIDPATDRWGPAKEWDHIKLLDPIEQVLTGTFLQVMDSIRPCLPAGLSLTEPPLDMLRHTGGLHTKEYRDVIFGIAYPHSGACALMEIGRNQVRLDVFYEEHQAISITEDETHIHVANNGFMPLPPGKIWQHAGIGMRSIVSTEDMRRTVLEILALFLDTVSRGELILHQRMLESKTEAPHQRRPDAASRNALKHPR